MSDPNLHQNRTTSPPFRRAVPHSLQPLSGIAEALFVHASSSRVNSVANFCATDEIGAVYALPAGKSRDATFKRTLERHRTLAGDATALFDANQYSGRDRSFAADGLDVDWVHRQHDAGLTWALTNSGYVDHDDRDGLERLFEGASSVADQTDLAFILELPLDHSWAADRADVVRDLVDAYGKPVAYMFGAAADPFASQKAVQGLAHLLGSPVQSSLLRSDQSAIGALALGASIGAIGTNSTMRHIYPPSNGFGRPTAISAMLPQGLSMHHLEMLALAAGLSPDDLHWLCPCDACEGGRVDMILDAEHAFRHTIFSSIDIARHVLASSTSKENTKSWLAKCQSAQFIHIDVANSTGMKWEAPRFLSAWGSLQ